VDKRRRVMYDEILQLLKKYDIIYGSEHCGKVEINVLNSNVTQVYVGRKV